MTAPPALIPCIGCQAMVPDLTAHFGPDHQYLGASPGCWQIYMEVIAQGFPSLTERGLSNDTYMVQHPGVPSRQSIQSVARHLMGLYCTLELRMPYEKATRTMDRAPVERFIWLDPPLSLGAITIVEVANVAIPRSDMIRQWAATTWQAWEPHHHTIREWVTHSFA